MSYIQFHFRSRLLLPCFSALLHLDLKNEMSYRVEFFFETNRIQLLSEFNFKVEVEVVRLKTQTSALPVALRHWY